MKNKILELFNKNKIHYESAGYNEIAIVCPDCPRLLNGIGLITFEIKLDNGNGRCQKCSVQYTIEELKEKMGLKDNVKLVKRKKKSDDEEEEPIILPKERIIKVIPEKETSFMEWKETIKSNFPELLFPAEIGLSIISQILLKDITNPFALALVDVPSSGKTITINFFADIEGITYATDKFTPASFVSNAVNVKKEKLPEIDLLPRIQYKTFLIRDLATLFSKGEEALIETIGLLTRVLDGEGLSTESGVHGGRGYTGEYLFMVLAATTPIQPRVWKVMGNLGSRLFFLSMNSKDKSEEELVSQITSTAHKDKEKICRTLTKNYIHTLWSKYPDGISWDKENDDKECKRIIAKCSKLLANLRGVINIWPGKNYSVSLTENMTYDYTPPIIERPDRINQLLYNLARGHAVLEGRNKITKEDLKPIVELSIDSAPTARTKLFRALIENGGTMKTNEVQKSLKCSKPTALKEMETLKILGVAEMEQESTGVVGEPESAIKLTADFEWFVSDECKDIRKSE